MPSLLETLDMSHDILARDTLADTISYRMGGGPFVEKLAFVEFGEQPITHGGSAIVHQQITVSIRKADVSAKPDSTTRLRIPEYPGKTWQPVDVETDDESGDHWVFAVKRANA